MSAERPTAVGPREDAILAWDDEPLKGAVALSEFSVFLIQDADIAFCAGAPLAALLAACAAIESHLRYELDEQTAGGSGFAELTRASSLSEDLRARIDELRRYRNQWVHVKRPHADDDLLNHPGRHRRALGEMATRAIRTMREVVYSNPWI